MLRTTEALSITDPSTTNIQPPVQKHPNRTGVNNNCVSVSGPRVQFINIPHPHQILDLDLGLSSLPNLLVKPSRAAPEQRPLSRNQPSLFQQYQRSPQNTPAIKTFLSTNTIDYSNEQSGCLLPSTNSAPSQPQPASP